MELRVELLLVCKSRSLIKRYIGLKMSPQLRYAEIASLQSNKYGFQTKYSSIHIGMFRTSAEHKYEITKRKTLLNVKFDNTIQYYTKQNKTAQHSTTQHSTAQHSTAQYDTIQNNTTQHNTIQYKTTQHSTARTAQHSTAQHNTIQYNNIQYKTIQHSTARTAQHNTA